MARNNPYSEVPAAPPDLDLPGLAAGRALELDVGFGRGQFLLERAQAEGDLALLGLEMRRKWVGLVAARAERLELENLTVLYGDARYLLSSWQPEGSFSAIYFHFPDPWWKKRHLKRLVVTAETIHHAARMLRPGGVLLVKTDVAERAEGYQRALAAEPLLAEAPADRAPGQLSHREKKCAEAGLPVYSLVFERERR